MAWRNAYSLDTLISQLNTNYPGWLFLGTKGDAAHQAVASDHNPNAAGVVCALDIGPGGGLDIHGLADRLAARPHPDLKYIISNRRIAEWQYGFKWRSYSGSDPHDTHIHVSVGRGDDGQSVQPYDDRNNWNIKGEPMNVPDTDAWYTRFNKLTQQIRGRSMSREEFRKNIVPAADPFAAVQILSDDPEADRNVAFANAGRNVFNEGDRQNLNNYLYGHDASRFKSAVGKTWKEAVYGAFESADFKTDQLVNKGDIGNLKTIIGTSTIPDSVVGKSWKDFVYQDLKGLIPAGGNAEQVLEQIRQLVNKEN